MRKLLAAIVVLAAGVFVFSGIASAAIVVAPGAHTSFDRTYNWVVTKTDSAHSSLTLAQNEVYVLTYTVSVGNGSPAYTDSNWMVRDGIPIHGNGSSFAINALSDVTATATQGGTNTAATVDECSTDGNYQNLVTFPGTWSDLLCRYMAPLPNGSPGTLTATVNFADGSTVSGSTPFDFATDGTSPTLELGQPDIRNASVSVVDSQAGTLGSVANLHPQTFTYTVPVPTGTCGTFDIPNTVTLIGDGGHTVGSATDTVHVTVACPHTSGCTLTQGYWKTHSVYGPAAKADPTWNLVGGPNATFFLSGQTWLQVFNTPPAGGNVYYQLAHQYEAAVLNQLDGASSTAAVTAAMADALSFFNSYTPAQAGALAKSSAIRAAASNDATTLDSYNSGLIGPGHCSE